MKLIYRAVPFQALVVYIAYIPWVLLVLVILKTCNVLLHMLILFLQPRLKVAREIEKIPVKLFVNN